MHAIASGFDKLNEARMAMEHTALTNAQARRFARDAIKLRFTTTQLKNRTYDPSDLLAIRREEDEGPGLWQHYNVVQENLIKGYTDHRYGNVTPINTIDGSVKLNRDLWNTAVGMLPVAA